MLPLKTEEDLLRVIRDKVQEGLNLEYKSSAALGTNDKKKTELSKDVSAMANSAGGVIVYSISEDGHVPTDLDEGLDPNEISKEWIEQILNTRIQRRIEGVTINQISLGGNRNGRVAYAISIPQSERAPHQAHDKRFYKRFNFSSVPMEEYEVRDVSNRSNGPSLSIKFVEASMMGLKPQSSGKEVNALRLGIVPMIKNESSVPAEYVAINLYLDTDFTSVKGLNGYSHRDGDCSWFGDGKYECQRYYKNHAIPGHMPIFSGMEFRLVETPISVTVDDNTACCIAYSLIAPNMPERTGATLISCIGGKFVFEPM